MTDNQKMCEAFRAWYAEKNNSSFDDDIRRWEERYQWYARGASQGWDAGAAWQAAQTGTGYIQSHSELNLSQPVQVDESYPSINECRAALNELCETYYNYGVQATRDKTAAERTEHLARAIDCKTRVAQIIGHLRTPQQPQPEERRAENGTGAQKNDAGHTMQQPQPVSVGE